MLNPYYQDEAVTIYHGDCREILPYLPKVDLVLTDPPYINTVGYQEFVGNGIAKRHVPSKGVGDIWQASLDWISVIKDKVLLGALVFCTYHSVVELANAFSGWKRMVLITWYKRNAAPRGSNVPRYTGEFIWGFARRPGLLWGNFQGTVFDIPNINAGCMATERYVDDQTKAIHPTQKPLALMKELLVIGGDSILDPFMGTGTTLRAAKDLGRKAIGIEIEEKYCEIAAKRMSQTVMDLS